MDTPPETDDDRPVVLLVEDEEAQRWLFSTALREQGFEVIEASEGDEAIRKCGRTNRIDLVVTDLRMPIMGGLELFDRLTLSHGELNVLFISAHPPDNFTVARGDVLRKPFTRETLVQRVNGILRGPSEAVQ
jgi:CheY-like chemotaxis protein